MPEKSFRISREYRTVAVMIGIYCREKHHVNSLCPECATLRDYAQGRLDACPFQAGKTTCARCPVHCYQPVMREKIRVVMRYSGPKMIYRHFFLALFHLFDGMRRTPVKHHE